MSTAVNSDQDAAQTATVRKLAAALAVTALIDVVWVKAPGLAMLAIPPAIAAWRYRRGRTLSTIALALWCVVVTLIGVTFMVSNGLHAPLEPGQTREWINPGDFVGVYIGTPIAVWLGTVLVLRLVRRRTPSPAGATA